MISSGNIRIPIVIWFLSMSAVPILNPDSETRASSRNALPRTETETARAAVPGDVEGLPQNFSQERFIALWDKERVLSLESKREIEKFLAELKLEVAEQEKRLAAEQEELAGFRELMDIPEASRKAGDRIKSSIMQLKRRRLLLKRPIRADIKNRLQTLQQRRYTVEDTLFSLDERWQETLGEAARGLTEKEARNFTLQCAPLASGLRTALGEEKNLLTEVIALGQGLQYLSVRRLDNIDEHERFIRSRVFWLQDVPPMGIETMKPVGDETVKLLKWLRDVVAGKKAAEIMDMGKRPMALLYGLMLLLAGPAALLYLRHRFRRAVKRHDTATALQKARPGEKGIRLLANIAGPAVILVYCLLLARFMGNTGLPNDVKSVLAVALEQTGYFLFFGYLSRGLFGARGLLPAEFGMNRESAMTLHTSFRQLLSLYITWLLLWKILIQQPFAFQALPRICYTVFELLAAVVIFRLIRPASPWVRHGIKTAPENPVSTYWEGISRLFMLLTGFIIFLDLAGYRYGAQSIAKSSVLSLVSLMLFPSVYQAVTAYIEAMKRWPKPSMDTPAPGPPPEEGMPQMLRVLRLVRTAAILLLLILLAVYWGIDQQALKTLEELHLYKMRGTGDAIEFVTAADLLWAGLYLAATFLILRWLPGLYEFALMPRLRLDEGMKYAVLTLTRYGIFIIGLLLAMAEIHLDLSRLGWLMAAMGVGLGFGLQEIVSNFVSGIILLTERPIQVNDVVTVGGITGTIRRINIRATTLVNFDRQEVIMPNRSLITTEVTNWTKSDTINRLTIKIGVAYGSNVDKVTTLLKEIAFASPWVMKEPAPVVVFIQHGDSSLDFELRVFTPSPDNRIETLNHINKEINRIFAEQGIEIPFPQRDLHIRSGTI